MLYTYLVSCTCLFRGVIFYPYFGSNMFLRTISKLQDSAFQKIILFIVTAVRTSNLTFVPLIIQGYYK
jgi:hypothetical protein